MTSDRRHPNQRELVSLPVELRRTSVPAAVRAWVTRQTGATIVRTRRLAGASSTAVHELSLSDSTRLVLRRYAWPGFLEDEPIAPRRELDALRFADSKGLPVPQVVAADITGAEVGDEVPTILMTFLPGRAVAIPNLDRLAELAATIHAIDPVDFDHDYFPWYVETMTMPPAATTRPTLWETAIELWHNAMPAYRPTFIHRDFHPGNVVWLRGRVPGIVDWANACRGPWGCDIAHCRANLVDLSGRQASDEFLAAYESQTGESFHPYWDLASIMENETAHWSPENLAEAEPQLERTVGFYGLIPPRRANSRHFQ